MAQYGLQVDTLSRLKGGSAVQTLAYFTRSKLHDEYNGRVYDYSQETDFLHCEVLLPKHAPFKYNDAFLLCNEIEQAEKRYDARIGRVSWTSLPNKLSLDDWKELVREFVNDAFVSLGMCAIWAIHDGRHPIDPTKNNPNAHILLTDRPVDCEGFCAKKDRTWNSKKHIRIWRRLWADIQNKMFERKGLKEVNVSHESLEVQGIDREPTVPLGRVVVALERRGIQTERGNRNREIEARNRERVAQEREQYRRRSRSYSCELEISL